MTAEGGTMAAMLGEMRETAAVPPGLRGLLRLFVQPRFSAQREKQYQAARRLQVVLQQRAIFAFLAVVAFGGFVLDTVFDEDESSFWLRSLATVMVLVAGIGLTTVPSLRPRLETIGYTVLIVASLLTQWGNVDVTVVLLITLCGLAISEGPRRYAVFMGALLAIMAISAVQGVPPHVVLGLLLVQASWSASAVLVAGAAERLRRRTFLKDHNLKRAKLRAERAVVAMKSAQAELVQAEKMAALGGLVAGVAHELNTPLGAALTSATLAEEQHQELGRKFAAEELAAEDLAEFIDGSTKALALMRISIGRAAGLVEAFKRVAARPDDMERSRFRVMRELSLAAESLRPGFADRGIRLELGLGSEVVMDGYPIVLAQVVRDILENARAHAFVGRPGGTVRLEAASEEGQLVVTIADDGTGIADVLKGRLFEPFVTGRRGAGHAGLGLHVVYNLVSWALGGQVNIDSDAGVGTTVRLTLPLSAPVRHRERQQSLAPAPQGGATGAGSRDDARKGAIILAPLNGNDTAAA